LLKITKPLNLVDPNEITLASIEKKKEMQAPDKDDEKEPQIVTNA